MPYYLLRSVEKISHISQKREYKDQMKSLFHHSLIKIIVLYHLKELNIAWSTFIANPIFTNAPTQNVQSIPSSSHPSTSIPPSHPIHHLYSSDDSATPSPPSSPFNEPIHSPSRDEDREKEHIEHGGISNPKRVGFSILIHTFQRGY